MKNLVKTLFGVVLVIGIPWLIIANFMFFLAVIGFLILAWIVYVVYAALTTES